MLDLASARLARGIVNLIVRLTHAGARGDERAASRIAQLYDHAASLRDPRALGGS
jgi:hypothetical protein